MRNIIPKARKILYEEIKAKLEARGYYVSPNYGLILKNKDDKYVIADIRQSESRVFVPYKGKETTEKKELIKILTQEDIPFRNKRFDD